MSRIGRLPVKLPSGVSVALKSDLVEIKGPKGAASVAIPKDVQVRQEGDEIVVAREGNGRQAVSYTHLDVYKRQAPAPPDGARQRTGPR